MIAMLISSAEEKEAGYLCVCCRDITGKLSDETLEIHRCPTPVDLKRLIDSREQIDLACIDITVPDALALAEFFRSGNGSAYLILIASLEISPVTYMRPGIRAESLILKPFQEEQTRSALVEAFREILRRYEKPDRSKVFVIDNQDGRILIEYDAISFFEARNKKIYLNTGIKEYGFYDTMEHLEKELGDPFIRCHRSFLVNRGKIEKTVLAKNMLTLKDGYEIPVSRTYRTAMRNLA